MLPSESLLRLKRTRETAPLSACLSIVDSPEGRHRVQALLATQPYPHFEPAPNRPGLIVKIDENGTRTLGRFVNRKFQPTRHG